MNLTRSQSLTIAIGSLGLFFALGILVVQNRSQGRISVSTVRLSQEAAVETDANTEQEAVTDLPSAAKSQSGEESGFILKNFHRSEVSDGQKIWEITADTGRYFPESNSIALSRASLTLYRKNGDVIKIDADQALVKLVGSALVGADASGNVVITKNGSEVTIKTDQASYNKIEQIVTTPGFVSIDTEAMEVSGSRLTIDLEKNEALLAEDVETLVKPRSKKS